MKHQSRPATDSQATHGVSRELWLDAITGVNLPQLRQLLDREGLGLLRLPPHLEAAFHNYARHGAAHLLRSSVYGLIALYLLVVVPVGFLTSGEFKTLWLASAVAPIGVVLAVVWIVSQLPNSQRYVEATLGGGVFVCLAGTAYCALRLQESFFGYVAAFESVYIIIVAFSVLRIRTLLSLIGCLAAGSIAATTVALQSPEALNWLQLLLFFVVPMLICTLNGYMLEYASRREFVQMLCKQKEKASLLQDLTAIRRQAGHILPALEICLERICTYMDWLYGRIGFIESGQLQSGQVTSLSASADPDQRQTIQAYWPDSTPSLLARDVAANGKPAWSRHDISLNGGDASMHYAFPVAIDEEAIAVMEFFAPRAEAPDNRSLMFLEQVSQRLGRLLEKERQEEHLDRATLEDRLTRLPNRLAFLKTLRHALARTERDSKRQFAVLFIGIDRFRQVNDSLGHQVGDATLQAVSHRLRSELHPSDVLARIGGDEFAILMDDLRNPIDAPSLVARIQRPFETPIEHRGQTLHITTTVGLTFSGHDYTAAEDMLDDANMAMTLAKSIERGGFKVFEPRVREQIQHRIRLSQDLKTALRQDQLTLHYQPITRIDTGRVEGFEALVRWNHPALGQIPPDEFIHLAEESNLIIPLTRWVLRNAARQLGLWQQELDADVMLSVNLCASFFAFDNLPGEIADLMREYRVRHGSLRLELTETELVDHESAAIGNIQRLSEAGIPVYIDDFGTGYSSLNYLANYRVSALKIDKSFMHKVSEAGKEHIVAKSIISLGHNLGLNVIAEGVESRSQLASLRDLGCDYVQGFLVAKPMTADEARGWIDANAFESATDHHKETVTQ